MVTVDELVVLNKTKYARLKKFMKDKMHRFGLKIWGMCPSHLQFVPSIEVYEGVGTGLGEHGLGYHVTMGLLDGYENFGHTVVVDNFFAFVRLFYNLMVKGLWTMGMIKGIEWVYFTT